MAMIVRGLDLKEEGIRRAWLEGWRNLEMGKGEGGAVAAEEDGEVTAIVEEGREAWEGILGFWEVGMRLREISV